MPEPGYPSLQDVINQAQKFLGELSEEQKSSVIEVLNNVLANLKAANAQE